MNYKKFEKVSFEISVKKSNEGQRRSLKTSKANRKNGKVKFSKELNKALNELGF